MFDIESVELLNFKTYRGHHSINFPQRPGLYLLTGRNEVEPALGTNAAGKSTLLDAIYWCLYGRTTRGLRAGDVVSWGETSCSVEMVMWLNDVPLKVKRSQSPNNLQTTNGIVPYHPVSQEDLTKRLGIGSEAFLHSVMLPQFGDSFLDLQPAAKLTLFSQVMELDYWLEKSKEAEKLATEISTDVQEQTNQVSRCQGQLETLKDDLQELAIKQRDYLATQRRIVAELKVDSESVRVDLQKTTEGLKFAESALANITKKLAKIEKGTQVCPTCQQTIPDQQAVKDKEGLLRNQADWERKQRDLQNKELRAKSKLEYLEKQIANESVPVSHVYANEIAEKKAKIVAITKRQAALTKGVAALEQDHAAVSYWVGGFKRVRLFLVEETLRQLEVEVNNNMSSLGLTDWRIEFDVERENKSGGVTKGFTVMVYAPGHKEPVRFEAWSGGETQRLRLAGNLGLANLIMTRAGLRNSVEFYDEPSAHLSEEGVNDLLETLRQRAMDTGRKIWVVEHHSLDYGEFAAVLTAVKSGEGTVLRLSGR